MNDEERNEASEDETTGGESEVEDVLPGDKLIAAVEEALSPAIGPAMEKLEPDEFKALLAAIWQAIDVASTVAAEALTSFDSRIEKVRKIAEDNAELEASLVAINSNHNAAAINSGKRTPRRVSSLANKINSIAARKIGRPKPPDKGN